MTMINHLSESQKKMIRSVVAGAPNYTQRQAMSTLRALERMGFVVDVDGKHQATSAGVALIEEAALVGYFAKHFHVGQEVEYSHWIQSNGFHKHEWKPATIARVYGHRHVGLKFEDGAHKMVFAHHVRSRKRS